MGGANVCVTVATTSVNVVGHVVVMCGGCNVCVIVCSSIGVMCSVVYCGVCVWSHIVVLTDAYMCDFDVV